MALSAFLKNDTQMNQFDDPIQFEIKKYIDGIEIEYSNLMEVSQGGSLIGNLSINGRMVDGLFGGPFIYHGEYLYLPVLVKKNLGRGFKLAQINTKTFDLIYLSNVRDLIFLDKVEKGKVFYFEDLGKTIRRFNELKIR